MTRETLALWAYTPPGGPWPLVATDYGARIEALEFTTVAPGGFGDLSCILKFPDARLPRPELGLFSRVALRDGLFTCFSGEWSDPTLVLDSTRGEYVMLSALGGGVALRDDPDDAAYTSATTAQDIITAEFARRASYLALDSDLAAVLPDHPANTFTPVYDGYTLEEILHDLMGALGDYVWTVYEHPTHKDAAGLPTWQLRAHQRDVTTTSYLALGADIFEWRVAPSAQRAYNVVQVAFVDPVAGPGSVMVSDPRLGPGGAQGNAPFRRRKLRRNLGNLPLTVTQATAIANAWLATYSNPSNKIEITLSAVRDASGNPLPLSHVRADANLYVPELAVRGQQLSSGPVPGVNQFYIIESSYRETAAGDVRLTLQLDNYADRGEALLARLQIADEARQRRRGVYRPVQSAGAQQVGYLSIRAPGASAGQRFGVGVNFVPVLSNTPTGLTFTAVSSSNVASGPTVTAGTMTPYGCEVTVTASASGTVVWTGKYTTVATIATTATTTAPKVHIEVPGFQAFGEFHGSNKDCSADAELMARHPLDGSPLDADTLNLWWSEYWNTGHHTSGGATLDHIYWHLTGSTHKLDPTKARVAKYIGTDTIPLAQLRAEIIAALARGQTVITYLGKALALPDNEHGVYGHFVALGGVDSDLGYLVGNGDTTDALGGHGIIPTHWHGWNELAAAEINGIIALEKVTVANVSALPTGWKDDGKTLVAPNGIPVVMGFREYVLAHAWDANNWPLAAEQVISGGSIEPGNASIESGSRQDFRLTSLGWTETRNVYVIYVGQDIRALEQQLAAANAHVAQLEQQLANMPAPAPTPADPKATEALAALVELAKALKLVAA